MNIPQIRLSNQKLINTDLSSPLEIVEWLGAVQAQDITGGEWTIGMRMKKVSRDAILKSIENKKIIRTWPMRGTLHYVPAADAKWMVKYLAERVNKRLNSYYKKSDLDSEVFSKARKILVKELTGGKSLTRPEIYEIFEGKNIASKKMRGLFILGHLAQEGTICFGVKKGNQPTFVLFDEWIKNSLKLEKDEALTKLAKRYFSSHGPAQIYDFMYWCGITKSEALGAIESLKLDTEVIENRTYYFFDSKEATAHEVFLLPPYDEYTIAYKDRTDIVEPNNIKYLKTVNGFWSSMILEGRVVGMWRRTINKETMNITLSPAIKLNTSTRDAFEKKAHDYAEFFGLKATVTFE